MGTNLISIGISGLNAAKVALSVVGQNVSNANTAGYTQQTFSQAANTPQYQGFGYLGTGVDVTSVTRVYNQYLTNQVQSSQTSSSYYTTLQQQLSQIDNLISSSSTGINTSMQSFFSSLQTLSQSPSSVASRQSVVTQSQSLVSTFTSLNSNLQQLQAGANSGITSTVSSINTLATQIANLNQQILSMTGGASGSSQPNDLLDQRDQAMLQLNQLVGATAVQQSDGSYTVYIGNGQTLVQGSKASALSTQADATNPSNVGVVYANGNGRNTIIPDSILTGGQLGGYINFRDGGLAQTQSQLGTLAVDFTTAMNYQNELGRDANGNQGTAMFTDLSGFASDPQNAINSLQSLLSDPSQIAAASSLQLGTAGITPTGTGVTLAGVWATIPGSYGWNTTATAGVIPANTTPNVADNPTTGLTGMTITSSATSATSITATLTGGPDTGQTFNVVADPTVTNGYKLMSNTTPSVALGISFQLSGQMQTGMTINVSPTPLGTASPGDANNLLQLANLQNKSIVDGTKDGSDSNLQTFQGYYSGTVSYVGNATSAANTQSTTQATMLQQATTNLSNYSGVNMDQEAASLIQYQQAYQASAQVIQTAQTVFQQLLTIAGGS